MKRLLPLSPMLLLVACDSNTARLSEAMTFHNAADKCLNDVKNGGLKYEASRSCTSLERLSAKYIAAGGQSADEPMESAFEAEKGRVLAWQARAISASGDSTLSLW